jgi:glycosyltransferase involved in cell wall biosynthesis
MTARSVPPRLSIGMPVYNGEKYMGRALDSVLADSFSDFELIISDNGSNDSTSSICDHYSRQDPRVRVIHHERTMIAPLNFRYVFEQAAGEYFMWLACDDWWRPGFIQQAIAMLEENPNVNLVFSHLEMYNWATDTFGTKRYVTSSYGGPKTRLMTRILNPSPYLVFGIFRKNAIRPEEILLSDFMEIHLPELLSIRGDTGILEGHFFVSGEKVLHRTSFSVFGGNRLRYRPYWKAVRKLLRQNFSLPTRWLMLTAIAVRNFRWMRHLE